MPWFKTILVGAALSAGLSQSVTAQQLRPPDVDADYHRAAVAWSAGGSLLEAKVRLDRVLNALPNDAEALKLRSKIFFELDRFDDALVDAERAVDLSPADGEAQLVLCRAARRLGKDSVAVAALVEAARLLEPDAVLHVDLSMEALALGRLEEAEAVARVGVALAPGNPEATMQLARVFAVRGAVSESATVLASGIDDGFLSADRVEADSLLVASGVAGMVRGQE